MMTSTPEANVRRRPKAQPMNPNPPKFVTGAQIRAGRALLGWRRVDLAAAAGLHRNAVGYWESFTTLPRQEPVACRMMRTALLSAGVITVSTPGPGVCLIKPAHRGLLRSDAESASFPQYPQGNGHRLLQANTGQQLCAVHSWGIGHDAQRDEKISSGHLLDEIDT